MRESIGTVSLLNFIIFFILLVFAFLAGTMSYYRAYRVNNAIVSAIEKFEGYNQKTYDEIEVKLGNIAYERTPITCKPTIKSGSKTGTLVNGDVPTTRTELGYCIYRYANDTIYKRKDGAGIATTDPYDTYEVQTIVTFKFPVIQRFLKLHVSSKTARIFHFAD